MFVEFHTIGWLWPEILLIALATYMYAACTFNRNRSWWSLYAILGYMLAAMALFMQHWYRWDEFYPADGAPLISGPLVIDFLGQMFRWLALLAGLLFTLIASRTASRALAGEVLGTLMLLIAGLMLVAWANELVLLFVALELISIPTYVLLFLGRRDRGSAEATAKYFFLSILSSALLLYGFSFLYGMAGTTSLSEIRVVLSAASASDDAGGLSAFAPIALVLIFAGLGFRMAAVPFHFYAPDVYQGTTNVNAGLLAVAPKIAGVVALVRLTAYALPSASDFAWQLSMALAMITMTIGNVCALWQQNVRRLMAYSSIAHAGYMLIGLAVGLATGLGGVAAMLFYLLVYVFASLGTFAALAYLGSEERDVSEVEELAGLGGTRPAAAAAIAAFMFSLAGIPPLAGFWGKFELFSSAISLAAQGGHSRMSFWFAVLAVVGALNAAIAAAYYLRVVAVMYFRPAVSTVFAAGGRGAQLAMVVCTLLVVCIGVVPGQAVRSAQMAEESTRLTPRPARRISKSADAAGERPTFAESPAQANDPRIGAFAERWLWTGLRIEESPQPRVSDSRSLPLAHD